MNAVSSEEGGEGDVRNHVLVLRIELSDGNPRSRCRRSPGFNFEKVLPAIGREPKLTCITLVLFPTSVLIGHDSPSAQRCAALRVRHCVSPFGVRSGHPVVYFCR
jgi:hypothetical protein